ncbi:base excision DNA repair protein [Verticillium dahliae VdLs.17]|uniref:Base excision DNA repair protein n=1 Tax=Verticillium dahliae (strain VdLs.17 / ATCC MYA-4575 / FGSC 10137) TaxID=498257 RepID=G2X4L1_VERDV|nr:base excision DNA repair protein [Verticillium dahliae VdLs.17]EGY23655.1 base excision DNA repair protein [Verticillium dahliae VdLs.17]
MSRVTRASARQAAATSTPKATSPLRSQARRANIKAEPTDEKPSKRKKTTKSSTKASSKRIKTEDDDDDDALPATPAKRVKKDPSEDDAPAAKPNVSPSGASPNALQAKKLKAFAQFSAKSPFPDFAHPTAEEAKLAHRILTSLHGARTRPDTVKAPTSRAGCGDSPSVLDALVRTILSQNTSDANSTRAKRSMDAVYGGSDAWAAIAAGGAPKLQEAIKCGGLAAVKSKVILGILAQAKARYGAYSLDHMFDRTDDEAMRELLAFQGVGPKTASCVLLFCLRRESFAVDTHDKYALHILLVKHGKVCDECKAGGKNLGKCALRKAFRDKAKGVAGASPALPQDEDGDGPHQDKDWDGDAKEETKEKVKEEVKDQDEES